MGIHLEKLFVVFDAYCILGTGFCLEDYLTGNSLCISLRCSNFIIAVRSHKHCKRICNTGCTCRSFLKDLSEKASVDVLRVVTDETLAYLNYLRRFAKPGEDEEAGE